MKMTKAGNAIQRYIVAEKLLKQFFSMTDFCRPNCISQPESRLSTEEDYIPGSIGCCKKDYHYRFPESTPEDIRAAIESIRISKHGVRVNMESRLFSGGQPCLYHEPEGCVLEELKPPICISYVCMGYEFYLRKRFGIIYHRKEIEEGLSKIITGGMDDEGYSAFIRLIGLFIRQVDMRGL